MLTCERAYYLNIVVMCMFVCCDQLSVALRLHIGRRELHECEIQLRRGPASGAAAAASSRAVPAGLSYASRAIQPRRLSQLVHDEELLVRRQL